MIKCQYCEKELSEAEVKSSYCFTCGKTVDTPSSKDEQVVPILQPKSDLSVPISTNEGIRCPNCNFLNPENTRSCNECGTSLSKEEIDAHNDIEKRACPNCGKEVKEHWKTCPQCGKSLTMEETKKEEVDETKEEGINKCSNCNKDVEVDWLSCPYCGKPLIKKKKEEVKEEVINKCSNCGKEVKKEWSACPYCEKPLIKKKKDDVKKVNTKLVFPDKSEKEIIGNELIIGREDFEECQRKGIITREQLSYISRRSKPHFKILNRDNEFFIIDENSANRTWIDGTCIEKNKEHKLHDNSEIILAGEKEIKVQFKIIER